MHVVGVSPTAASDRPGLAIDRAGEEATLPRRSVGPIDRQRDRQTSQRSVGGSVLALTIMNGVNLTFSRSDGHSGKERKKSAACVFRAFQASPSECPSPHHGSCAADGLLSAYPSIRLLCISFHMRMGAPPPRPRSGHGGAPLGNSTRARRGGGTGAREREGRRARGAQGRNGGRAREGGSVREYLHTRTRRIRPGATQRCSVPFPSRA